MDMNTTSCKLDPIPTGVLKQILPTVIDDITKLINACLEQAVFVRHWKSAIVRPLLKKIGLELISSNYRLVSNLSFLPKLLEKCALSQFMHHCETYNLLPDYQSAYQKGYSCETYNLKLANDILCNMEIQQVTPTILLDLSAAFDTVDHDLLLQILENDFRIKGTALDWYKYDLYPRDYRVYVGRNYSEPKDIFFSVPQGSASGANIFSAYCSSLYKVLEKGVNIQGFADDHSIRSAFKGGNNHEEITSIKSLQDSFDNITDWMNQMKLKLNTSKTEFIILYYIS